jgi:DNA-directed RNA polymerase subunit RPC12/RpoP
MTGMDVETRVNTTFSIDVCAECQTIWFDKYQDLQMAPGSTLKLMKFIGEHSSQAIRPPSNAMRCPRCSSVLVLTHDMAHSTRFIYMRCPNGHGRYIAFLDFLREKNFIKQLSPQQIQDLRQNVQTVNCSNCGAAIDLATSSTCTHCGSPISMLDMKQPQELLKELQAVAAPRPANPTLAVDLELAKLHTDLLFDESNPGWWKNADSKSSLVHAGLDALTRFLTRSGI